MQQCNISFQFEGMKRKKAKKIIKVAIIILIFISIVLISGSLTSSQIETLGTFKKNSCVPTLQICSNCTSTNITSISISGPDSIKLLGFAPINRS